MPDLDASQLMFSPRTVADWTTKPTEADAALDELADRATRKFFDAYDGAGGQAINASATTVNIDTTRTNTDSTVFALASDVVTLTGSGTAIIDYRSTLGTTGSGDFQFEVWLELNSSEIAGSRVRAGKGT